MYNSWIEVSKSAILHNLGQFKKIVGKNVEIMPIIKSNAYGHGMVEIAKIVAPKIKWLGVVSLGEALELRRQKIKNRIFVLSYINSFPLRARRGAACLRRQGGEAEKFVNPLTLTLSHQGRGELIEGIRQNIDLPIYDFNYAELISQTAKKIKRTAKVHIKIDTGASRIGILTNEAINFIKKINKLPNLKIEGIFSHFAASEENPEYSRIQLNKFNKIIDVIPALRNATGSASGGKAGIQKIPYQHLACSAATLVQPNSHFNLVRIGIGLYGLWPSAQTKKIAQKLYPNFNLKPALSWKTKIIQIKTIPQGTKIGYGCTYTCKKKTKLAILPVGYWEGYDRHLSNAGPVLVRGQYCPILGRICMNLTMVDVTGVKNTKVGDEVVLIGRQGRSFNSAQGRGEITAEELAEKIGTINYEVVTRINPLLPRIYIK